MLPPWEHWPFEVVYASVFLLHLWQGLKARNFFYFSAANPGIENGGLIGERKSNILASIPKNYQPDWLLIDSKEMAEEQLPWQTLPSYPFICKPDVGERGQGVTKITDKESFLHYFRNSGQTFLVQAFVDLPLEAGVFYYRIPGETKGRISSITAKHFLQVKGNGRFTLAEWVKSDARAQRVEGALQKRHASRWNSILPEGEVLVLEEIGNHCRGTMFLDACDRISPQMEQAFDRLADQIPGFDFGRFDIRFASWEALEQGEFQILELNGSGAEPSHIYHPGFSFWKGQKVLWQHARILYQIARIRHREGQPYWTLAQAKAIRKNHALELQKIARS